MDLVRPVLGQPPGEDWDGGLCRGYCCCHEQAPGGLREEREGGPRVPRDWRGTGGRQHHPGSQGDRAVAR
jgi:hypothetical protein